jgi:hypothetical protein
MARPVPQPVGHRFGLLPAEFAEIVVARELLPPPVIPELGPLTMGRYCSIFCLYRNDRHYCACV